MHDIAFLPRLAAGIGCVGLALVGSSVDPWIPAGSLALWLLAAPWLGRGAQARRSPAQWAFAAGENTLPPGLGVLAGLPFATVAGFAALLALGNMALGGPRRCLAGLAMGGAAGASAALVVGVPPPASAARTGAMLALIALFALAMTALAHHQTVRLRHAREGLRQQAGGHAAVAERLARYLPPQLHRVVLEGDDARARIVRRAWLTVCYADVAGFTALTEAAESEELAAMLDDLYAAIAETVQAYGGTLDKFIGDAALVFFGEPDTVGRQADALACVALARELRARLAGLREQWRRHGMLHELHLRVGIDSGWCTVGTFGAGPRLEYTVIGTAVNAANRLQQHAAPGEVVVSGAARALLGDAVGACRPLGAVAVRGLTVPVAAFALIDTARPANPVRVAFRGFSLELDPSLVDAASAVQALAAAGKRLDGAARAARGPWHGLGDRRPG